MPTKYIFSKHTKKIQKGTDPFCIFLRHNIWNYAPKTLCLQSIIIGNYGIC